MNKTQQIFFALNYSNTLALSRSFDSTIIFWLTNNDIKHHMKKNTKGIYFLLGSEMSGKPIAQDAAPNKFTIVE